MCVTCRLPVKLAIYQMRYCSLDLILSGAFGEGKRDFSSGCAIWTTSGVGKTVRSQFQSAFPQTPLFPCWGWRRDKLTTSPAEAFHWRMPGRWGVERGEWPGVSEAEPGVRRRRGCRWSLLSTFSFEMIGTTAASPRRRSATTRSDGERSTAVGDADWDFIEIAEDIRNGRNLLPAKLESPLPRVK